MFRATRFALDDDRTLEDRSLVDDDLDEEDVDEDDEDLDEPDDEEIEARLARAAAAAPTIRADGKILMTEAVCRLCGATEGLWAEPNLCARCARIA